MRILPRRGRWWIVAAVLLAVVIGVALLALPPVARRVAISQLHAATGRASSTRHESPALDR